MTTPTLPTVRPDPRPTRAASLLAVMIALLYLLLATGVLDLGDADRGELGILGAAGVLHLVIAAALWWRPRRWLLAAVVAVQLAMAAMYVAIAPERVPPYELWGLTIRALSALLVLALVLGLVAGRRARPG
ncbi:MAG: hypothetical protein ACNA8R_01870 [Nitriliruptoraceae bacterium]